VVVAGENVFRYFGYIQDGGTGVDALHHGGVEILLNCRYGHEIEEIVGPKIRFLKFVTTKVQPAEMGSPVDNSEWLELFPTLVFHRIEENLLSAGAGISD
jgi:hypothetical protein